MSARYKEEVKLRRARPAEVPALLRLMAAFNRAEGISFRRAAVEAGLRRLLRDRRLGVVIVAEGRARALIGYAVGTFGYDLEFAGPDAFLTELFVRPEARGRGLGARLLDAVTSELRNGGARAVTLLVAPKNRAAQRLYARAGFERVPRLAMVKRLQTKTRA
jgi:ribosomal protein S18 acetylase RimI-like enzyme